MLSYILKKIQIFQKQAGKRNNNSNNKNDGQTEHSKWEISFNNTTLNVRNTALNPKKM